MTPFLVLLGFVLGLMVGYLFLSRKPKQAYQAIAEYWVYLPGDSLPDQTSVMTRMVSRNPYAKNGVSPIGSSEGLIFSDVRLHIALVRRSQNAHVFRPDLFTDIEVDATVLDALAEANSFVKLRFVSEEPLPDKRHIQFLIHAADAYAEEGHASLIYDTTAGRMILRNQLRQWLSESQDATRPELHTRCLWHIEADGGRVETMGLRKIGRHELKTSKIESDERMLVASLIEEAVSKIWQDPSLSGSIEVSTFHDQFKILLGDAISGYTPVRILRIQQP